MKKVQSMAIGMVFAFCLVATGQAATVGPPAGGQGIKNAKKAAIGKREQDKKRREVKEKAKAQRQQAQGGT